MGTNEKSVIICVISFICGAWAGPGRADVVLVNFDNVSAVETGTLYPGTTFSNQGVSFASCISPSTLPSSSNLTLSGARDEIKVNGNANCISSLNFITATTTVGTNDILMSFAVPIFSIQVTTDDPVESGDLVRLLALEPTENPWEFTVIGIAEGFDDATTSPANLLAIDLGNKSFSFALFQVTTESEGFDDLIFETVPEASGTWLSITLMATTAALGSRIRRRAAGVPPDGSDCSQ